MKSKYMSERMPERMSHRKSKYMEDRMSAFVSVECYLAEITRRKYLFLGGFYFFGGLVSELASGWLRVGLELFRMYFRFV